MSIMSRVSMYAFALGMAACAQRIPEPALTGAATPHVSWVVMAGDRENPDRDYVCQSDPRDACEMRASRPNAPVFSDVHLYYHGTGIEMKYTGTIRLGFLTGNARVSPEVMVTKREEIARESINGTVTTTPGTYELTIDVTATRKDGAPVPIRVDVPVVVK